jgi:poly-gamma-glutamate synthesis protein (capsule biosynthesis protein)
MSPENAECLAAAELDVCVLANNHVMDFGLGGLRETLATLDRLGIAHAGAGQTLEDAEAPAIVDLGERGRVLVFSIASPSSGVPRAREASSPGVAMELSLESVRGIRARIERHARPGDIVVLSIHWGPNWGHEITSRERRFAHGLVDDAGVHVVHGHSSHHVKAIEPYHGRLILYGCGDLLTDYEGIRGNERYRGELGLMYFATLDLGTGRCERVEMTPTRVHRLRVTRASHDEALWLAEVLRHEAGASVELDEADRLHLRV